MIHHHHQPNRLFLIKVHPFHSYSLISKRKKNHKKSNKKRCENIENGVMISPNSLQLPHEINNYLRVNMQQHFNAMASSGVRLSADGFLSTFLLKMNFCVKRKTMLNLCRDICIRDSPC